MEEHSTHNIKYPIGHPNNTENNIDELMKFKFRSFGNIALQEGEIDKLMAKLENLENLKNAELRALFNIPIKYHLKGLDE